MFEGQRIRLRGHKKEDVAGLLAMNSDLETRDFVTYAVPRGQTYEEALAFYQENGKDNLKQYYWAIEHRETGAYMGFGGWVEIDWVHSVATVAIALSKEFWNKGYGTEAMQLIVDHIFSRMSLNKVKLTTFGFNKRAQKSFAKVGFVVEGNLRRQLFRFGTFHDIIAMGMLREEWEAAKAHAGKSL
jgi:RimJ/RimL family protein N-acetyltransferase